MKLHSNAFANGEAIPERFAFCKFDADAHCVFSDNHNPDLTWSDVPAATKSFALICFDPDVPAVGDDVNQEGKTVSVDLPRVDFFHWLVAHIPVHTTSIAAASLSSGVTPKGKQYGSDDLGECGINDYTNWFAGDPEMGGDYGGYDGPCPPWNDERLHHYHFVVYALDCERVEIADRFTGHDLRAAIEGHILDQAEWVGTYTLNPALRS